MTQVIDGTRVRELKLPSFLGPHAYVPVEGFTEWWNRMQGRYQWCGSCRVARLASHHRAHQVIHHPNWKHWNGGHYQVAE